MTYKAPELVLELTRRFLDPKQEDVEPTYRRASALVHLVSTPIAQDVVTMTATALAAIEQHDPSCLSLYGDNPEDSPCDCSWAAIATVIVQLKDKVGIVP